MRLGFIGTGTIATAVVQGIAQDDHAITVSERSAKNAQALSAAFPNVAVASNQGVVEASDVVFVALLADTAKEVLSALRFRADQVVISFMAGADLADLSAWVAPARAEAIMLPFPGIARGGSPILVLGETGTIGTIFSARNSVFSLKSKAELDAYICAQAVLSPAVLMVSQAADWMAAEGMDRTSGEAFLRVLVGSSLLDGPCQPTLEALNTPGGYNQRLRQQMEGAGMGDALSQGLTALKG